MKKIITTICIIVHCVAFSQLTIPSRPSRQGVVLGWGDSRDKGRPVPADLTNVVSVVSDINYNLALKAHGSLAAWGYDTDALATGETVIRGVPKQFSPMDNASKDIFEEEIKRVLGTNIEFVDDWNDYHVRKGNVHCGSNVKRTPISNWWNELSNLPKKQP